MKLRVKYNQVAGEDMEPMAKGDSQEPRMVWLGANTTGGRFIPNDRYLLKPGVKFVTEQKANIQSCYDRLSVLINKEEFKGKIATVLWGRRAGQWAIPLPPNVLSKLIFIVPHLDPKISATEVFPSVAVKEKGKTVKVSQGIEALINRHMSSFKAVGGQEGSPEDSTCMSFVADRFSIKEEETGYDFPKLSSDKVVGDWHTIIKGDSLIGFVKKGHLAFCQVNIANSKKLKAFEWFVDFALNNKRVIKILLEGASDEQIKEEVVEEPSVKTAIPILNNILKATTEREFKSVEKELQKRRQDLLDITRKYDKYKQILSGDIIGKFEEEIQRLRESGLFSEVVVKANERSFSIFVKEKIFFKYGDVETYLGEMLIGVEWSMGTSHIKLNVVNLDNAREGRQHPHLPNKSDGCWGSVKPQPIFEAGEIFEGFVLVKSFLQTWTPEDSYGDSIREWDTSGELRRAREEIEGTRKRTKVNVQAAEAIELEILEED